PQSAHGTQWQPPETIAMLRRCAKELDCPVAILGDLQGPRIRVGDINGTIYVEPGEDLVLVHEGLEREGEIPITYDHLADDVHVGDRILIDDGLIELLAMEVTAPRVKARVVHGGPINPHKGLNLPGVHVSAPSITDKDIADVQFAVEQDLDYLALSFVRRARDIEELGATVSQHMLVRAKIGHDGTISHT